MFFKISTPRVLAFFFYKTCNFRFFLLLLSLQVFQPNRKSPLGVDNKLLEKVFGHGLVFNFLSQILAIFLCNLQVFLNLFEIFCHLLGFSSLITPHNVLWGLILGYCIASICNGMFFKFLI